MKLKELLIESLLFSETEKEILAMSDTEIMQMAKKSGRKAFNALQKVLKAGLKKEDYSHPVFKYVDYSSVNGIDPDHTMSDALESVMDLVDNKYKKENKSKIDTKSRMAKGMMMDLLFYVKFVK